MSGNEIDNAVIRHINLSGDMYSRLVFGEESRDKNFLYQKNLYIDERPLSKWLSKLTNREPNYIEPRFRKLDKSKSYIYVVSLWGNTEAKKLILRKLYEMKRKHGNILIVGYWGDPGFDLDVYDGYEFDLLVTSQEPHMRRWDNLHFLHFPVASLGLLNKNVEEKYDCFSIGTHTSLRLNKILSCEKQFHENDISCYYCIAGMNPDEQQEQQVAQVRQYRDFPDRDFMAPDDTLLLCKQTRVLLNISRLPDSYEASPSFYAIMFNKKLLIDTDEIKKNPYYDPRFMKVVNFESDNWLTPELVKWIKTPEKIDYGYKGEWEADVFYDNVRTLLKGL